MLVSYIVVTFGRPHVVKECIDCILKQNYEPKEVILVDANANPVKSVRNLFGDYSRKGTLKIIEPTKNRGAWGNRNIGIKEANGEILIFVDDDALLKDPYSTKYIVERFRKEETLGILAFKSVNFYTQQNMDVEFPHYNKKLDRTREFETFYFVGVGHAIKREVLEKTGLYPWEFFYRMGEYDLSFRILDAGYKICYFPKVTVYHKLSPGGRVSSKEKMRRKMENKLRIAIRLLPFKYVLLWLLIRSLQTLVVSRGNLFLVYQALRNIIRDYPNLKAQRKVIAKSTIRRIYSLGGTLLY